MTQSSSNFDQLTPSPEQKQFVTLAKAGHDILVDACIGSGKTTAIQKLCESLPANKRVLYLTYNRLLKLDAQTKIRQPNVLVQNYHGFAYGALARAGVQAGVSDLIQTFLRVKPAIFKFDVLILDEYQDIEVEIAKMLFYIKAKNPGLQIVAVGDMAQKIYDKTTLNVRTFMSEFLGPKAIRLEFTQCFRLSAGLAARLGHIWGKKITGVNPNCLVETMHFDDALSFMAEQKPEDLMCLGSRTGPMSDALNYLELHHSDTFNKQTVYASISNDKRGMVSPRPESAIFTTFDSSKGMERKICVIFDWSAAYWGVRLNRPQQHYQILRNIFLVAASRGKDHIIFVNTGDGHLSDESLMTPPEDQVAFADCSISELFAFKYREDVERAYELLRVTPLKTKKHNEIEINSADGLIDLAPCISVYQLAHYFSGYNIDREIDLCYQQKRHMKMPTYQKHWSLDKKILLLTSMMTNQWRYRSQVDLPFVSSEAGQALSQRISEVLAPTTTAQQSLEIDFNHHYDCLFSAVGYADAVKDETVYQLVYATAVQHEQLLMCACEMVALGKTRGVVWNTRTNERYAVTVSDVPAFMDAVVRCATKGYVTHYE